MGVVKYFQYRLGENFNLEISEVLFCVCGMKCDRILWVDRYKETVQSQTGIFTHTRIYETALISLFSKTEQEIQFIC